MKYTALIALNAIILIKARESHKPVLLIEAPNHRNKTRGGEHEEPARNKTKVLDGPVSDDDSVPDWTQYKEGDRAAWKKYTEKPKQNGTESGESSDWMKFASPFMGGSDNKSNSTEWNGGQGDGFGEPFRSKTGGDARYKTGRDWNSSSKGGWQQFAAPYSSVNPEEPGSSNKSGGGGSQDWQTYMSPQSGGQGGAYGSQSGGGQDWNKYQSGAQDWQKYMGGSGEAGGFFELEVSGKDLNVTTDFGLGQGHGGNTSNSSISAGGGGGGGNQNSITAKTGKIYIRGRFLNHLVSDQDVVPA